MNKAVGGMIIVAFLFMSRPCAGKPTASPIGAATFGTWVGVAAAVSARHRRSMYD
jgi:hypothetical protein